MKEGTTKWFEYGGKTMRVQHIAGDLILDFKLEEFELEGAVHILEAEGPNPGLRINVLALAFDVVKIIMEMAETGEWKKHFPDVDDDAS